MQSTIAATPTRTLTAYRDHVIAAVRSRAIQVAVGLWGTAMVLLVVTGNRQFALTGLENAGAFALFALLTAPLVGQVSPPLLNNAPTRKKLTLWIQVSVTLLLLLLSAHDLLRAYGLLPQQWLIIPYWTPFISELLRSEGPARSYLGAATLYFALPAAALLLVGARWRELGVTKGYRVWRQAALWCFAPLAVLLLGLALAAPAYTWQRVLAITLTGGPFEEFLFRGVLLTRLMRVLGREWALVLSSLAFGLWHAPQVAYLSTGSNLWVGAAASLVGYGVLGMALGLLFLRTRTLLAPSLLHIIGVAAFG